MLVQFWVRQADGDVATDFGLKCSWLVDPMLLPRTPSAPAAQAETQFKSAQSKHVKLRLFSVRKRVKSSNSQPTSKGNAIKSLFYLRT